MAQRSSLVAISLWRGGYRRSYFLGCLAAAVLVDEVDADQILRAPLGADIHCESAATPALERAARLAIAISAFFVRAKPDPDPALSVVVEEDDPSLLEG